MSGGLQTRLFGAALMLGASSVAALGQSAEAPDALPTIDVVGTSPLAGAGVDREKIPAMAQSVKADDVARSGSASVVDALARSVPGVSLSDVQGNSFSPDLFYRGFNASPVQGSNQGLAVYQNGVRVNEAFGDTVNWDFIPPNAINRIDVWTNNPLFGLNALGGAVNIQMKNGFTWQGLETEIKGGSFGRIGGSFQYGVQKDAFSLYVAADALRDGGWRQYSPSTLARIYSDLGWRNDNAELHLVASSASNKLGVVGPTPVQALQNSYSSVYTSPQTTQNQSGTLALNGRLDLTSTWTLQGNVYLRRFDQSHVDGNAGDFEQCSSKSSFPTSLCLQDDAFPTPAGGKTTAYRNQFVLLGPDGKPIPFATAATPYGTIDRTWTRGTTLGGSVQATNTDRIADRDNYLSFGASLDHSWINFQSNSTLGYIYPNLIVGTGAAIPRMGSVLRTAGSLGYAPVGLNAENNNFGLYAIDTYNLTPELALTAGTRLNLAQISMRDATGLAPELNGDHSYARLNPMIGLAYKLPANTTIYAGYSEANRVPTPAELNCSDPARPCLLENALVSDPPLKQVVSKTYEAGLRGNLPVGPGSVDWKFGAFRTDSTNDIIPLASFFAGRGYFANVPATRRQGLEFGAQYQTDNWLAYLNYSLVDATYQFSGSLASPNNPFADANGNIAVSKGAHIPSIPMHQLKVGAEYAITPKWKFGADVSAISSQYYNGDDSNQNPKLPAYWVAGLHTSYQLTDNVQVFGQITNLFNRRFGVYGSYFDVTGVALAIPTPYTNPQMQTPLQPFSVYGGVKATF